MMEEVGMSNIGIAVKSGSFLRIVYGNKLACQDNLGPNNMEAQRFIIRLTLSAIVVVVVMKLLCDSCFGQRASASGETETGIHLTADEKGAGVPLVHFWSKVVGAGRANEGLRATWQEELATAGKYDGFQYIRFHGIFHDDMWVYRDDNSGKPI